MSVLIAIPARYASTRYPGKPLVPLTGASGNSQSLIERSWRAAMATNFCKLGPKQIRKRNRRSWIGIGI